jgi:alkylhydroperoxidase/carboxymuconolactone decarboxylase family protein YurZ
VTRGPSLAEPLLNFRRFPVTDTPTNARKNFGDIAPHLADITDKVLFGDVWADATLSPRDRSLVTISSLTAPTKCPFT